MRRTWWIALGAVAAAAALVAVGVQIGRGSGVPSSAPSPSPSPSPTASPAWVEFRDDEAQFTVSYPGEWERIAVDDEQVRLLVTPNARDSFLVRVVRLDAAVASASSDELQALTDEIVLSGGDVELVKPADRIELAGRPGYAYVYRFTDTGTDETGIHSHYFLFDGNSLVALVFQALPEERFDALAPVFDRIAASFTFLSPPPQPPSPSATAAPDATAPETTTTEATTTDETTPGGTPGETTPGETTPGETTPGDTRTEEPSPTAAAS